MMHVELKEDGLLYESREGWYKTAGSAFCPDEAGGFFTVKDVEGVWKMCWRAHGIMC